MTTTAPSQMIVTWSVTTVTQPLQHNVPEKRCQVGVICESECLQVVLALHRALGDTVTFRHEQSYRTLTE
jgi:hypothetical protein